MLAYLPLIVEWMGVVAVTLILSLSPALQRRPLVFAYPRREAIVALSLLTALFLVGVILATQLPTSPAAALPPGFTAGEQGRPQINLMAQAHQVILTLAGVFLFALVLRVRGQPWLSAGLGRQTLRGSLQLGIALGLITIFLTNRVYAILDGITAAEASYFLAMLVIGLGQEFIFRGYVQPRLSGFLGERWGWLITAVLFTIWHIPNLLSVEFPDLGIHLLFLFAFGLLLGWIMRKSGNILAPGIYHVVHNWVMVL